mgnify:CR=1 FL=1
MRILSLILLVLSQSLVFQPAVATGVDTATTEERLELGRRMYMEGVLPSGEVMTATMMGDIPVTGEQVICGSCHRRSGLGSSEGQEVVPAVAGDLLYEPLRLPTSKPPLPPARRPAYTEASLKAAIRDGVGASGEALGAFMPRYHMKDEELEILLDYLRSLPTYTAPGVTDEEIHFATIVTDDVSPATRKAMEDVLHAYFVQKNTETRNESQRAAHAPWHKEWMFRPYRKWVLHIWELRGARKSWGDQLRSYYHQQQVFAILNGVATGSWAPIHDFCEAERVPCLFPTTDLPVVNEADFYPLYLSKGMTLEAGAIQHHLIADGLTAKAMVQVLRADDARAAAAAQALQSLVERREGRVENIVLEIDQQADDAFWKHVIAAADGNALVLWLGAAELESFWMVANTSKPPQRIYLSTTLFDSDDYSGISAALRERLYFVHPYELPGQLTRLLARSTGWLRAKRIYAPDEKKVQANAYFSMKMAGEGLKHIRGFFNREYFIERIEHMIDNANYTSVYPRISLAPNQRFVSKGIYITQLDSSRKARLQAVSDWLVPGTE